MAFLQYPAEIWIKTVATGETVLAGGITVPDDQQLKHIVLTLYKRGVAGGSERFRVKIFHDEALTKLYATGDWFTISTDISNLVSNQDWLGRVRMDFSGSLPWIEAGVTYWIGIEFENYTRNTLTYYLSFLLDWPFPINTQLNSPNNYSLAMELYSYRRLSYG